MCLTTGAKHAKPSANHALGGTKVHTSVPKIEMSETKHERTCKSAGLPACLIGKCCFCFCFWFVLVPLFCCYAFLVRLNRVHPPPPPCYGRLAFIWRIAYIQDLPSAALFDSKKFDGVPISSFREHLRTLWQRGKNIQRCVVFLMKASRVFDNQFHHRICNFGPLTSAALCSI